MYSQDKNDRVAIFIDGENIHYSAKHMNMRLDYLKMCKRLANGRKLVRAHFYTAISNQSEGKIDFVNFLRLNGFKVVTQEIKIVEGDDGVEQKFYRGNLDLDMAVDIYELLPHVDTIILCTGDGDFIRVVDSIGRQGKHVEVCALREMTS
ncbi:NYN domain-containing protein, partial [bacterium]|nr:NYN domain-containing protein [bacterium]